MGLLALSAREIEKMCTLGELAKKDYRDRLTWIVAGFERDLVAVLSNARAQGLDAVGISSGCEEENLCPERNLAWAIAWNLSAPPPDHQDPEKNKGKIVSRYDPETPFNDLWSRFRLIDLAWSVACEQRTEWQAPGNIRSNKQDEAFERVKAFYDEGVRAVLRARLPSHVDIDGFAHDAWARMFAAYWARTANRRFLGLSTIKTIVITIARHEFGKSVRRDQPPQSRIKRGRGLPDTGQLGTVLRSPTQRIALMTCISNLPPKQALYSFSYHVEGRKQKEIAQLWQTTVANIGQQLASAWKRLKQCLKSLVSSDD